MTQKGFHTWDITISYHACPSCGHIQEDRQEFTRQADSLDDQKQIVCQKCRLVYLVLKQRRKSRWPLWSKATDKAEITWK